MIVTKETEMKPSTHQVSVKEVLIESCLSHEKMLPVAKPLYKQTKENLFKKMCITKKMDSFPRYLLYRQYQIWIYNVGLRYILLLKAQVILCYFLVIIKQGICLYF